MVTPASVKFVETARISGDSRLKAIAFSNHMRPMAKGKGLLVDMQQPDGSYLPAAHMHLMGKVSTVESTDDTFTVKIVNGNILEERKVDADTYLPSLKVILEFTAQQDEVISVKHPVGAAENVTKRITVRAFMMVSGDTNGKNVVMTPVRIQKLDNGTQTVTELTAPVYDIKGFSKGMALGILKDVTLFFQDEKNLGKKYVRQSER